MKRRSKVLVTLTLMLSGFILAQGVQAAPQLQLDENEVVVLTGGTDMVYLQRAGYLETILTDAFAAAKPTFRDLSWEADTVSRQGSTVERWREDGFGDWNNQLELVGTTVVIAQYGKLESMVGGEGLEAFVSGYNALIDGFLEHADQVVLVSPTPFEKPQSDFIPDVSRHNLALAQYVLETKKIAEERGLPFVDLFTDAKSGLTDNGMHLKEESLQHVSETIAAKLGFEVPSSGELATLHTAVVEKQRLWFDYWRPANWKLLYGDDSRRQFTKSSHGYMTFREEWKQLEGLIEKAEERIWTVANGGKDPGHNRPAPELLFADPIADIDAELASFTVPDGMQVNLFASEADGLTTPLAIRWDTAGRMYVTVTTTYPHVFPGDVANDKIIVLEDADHDGVAEKSTVFADGLNIPTAMELGEGGVYVGQSNEIIFLKDTDGDGKADSRRVLLSGFGTGDTHQTINSFIWSPDGELYMGQGDGIESRVETPWGSADLYQAGFYRLRPRLLQMHPLLDDFMGPGNPWGVAFSEWGQIYSVDGAGGVTHLSLGQIPSTNRSRLAMLGEPGGYCGITFLDGRQIPESYQGHYAIGDFQANRVKRFSVTAKGSGADLKWEEPLIYSSHRNFRPVDVKVGPDGAVYVVDWYNTVICHQDDEYRDPTRDKAHGRIWRISSSSSPTVSVPNLYDAPLEEVVAALGASERWTRYQAKRELTRRDTDDVAAALGKWAAKLDPEDAAYEKNLYEAIGAYATIEVPAPALLGKLLEAKEPGGRAFAARLVGRWHDRLEDPLALLAKRVDDDNAQVRMEAVAAAAAIPAPESITVVARAVDRSMDDSMEYVFSQAIQHLKPHWEPAHKRGDLQFAKTAHLAEVLNRAGGKELIADLRKIALSYHLEEDTRLRAIENLVRIGGEEEIEEFVMNPDRYVSGGEYNANSHARILAAAAKATRSGNLEPSEDPWSLNDMLEHSNLQLRANAAILAGAWKAKDTRENILAMAKDDSLPEFVRIAAFGAIADLQARGGKSMLSDYAAAPNTHTLRVAAIEALVALDSKAAAKSAVKLFGESDVDNTTTTRTLVAFLNREGGVPALTAAIESGGLGHDAAKLLLRSFYASGRSDNVLLAALNTASGAGSLELDYDADLVKSLAENAEKQGDAARGAVLFTDLGCVACHQVGETGAVIGPNLTAVGTTLSAERIIEETLWPNRQIKEGFTALEISTYDFMIYQGYARRTKESEATGDLVIQDLATQELITIKEEDIEGMRETGSPMPAGLTSLLSQSQLLDLFKYVTSLGKMN
jgi:putative heme-binding domain-containing protein